MKIETFADLNACPPRPDFLVEDILPKRALGMIYGQSGCGKTFLALDMQHSISTGEAWLGRAVAKGCGLYVAAEGVAGFPARAQAWHQARGRPSLDGMRYLREPLAVHDEGQRALLCDMLAADGFRPDLIVIDTASANGPTGFDDTKADHWKRIFDGAVELMRTLSCAMLFIHHPGHGIDRLRGSYDQIARADVIIRVEKAGELGAKLVVEKARDFGLGEAIDIRFRKVVGSKSSDADTLSLVPELSGRDPDAITAMQKTALSALAQAEKPLKAKEWMTKAGLAERTFYRVRGELLATPYLGTKGSTYHITDAGRVAILDAMAEATLPTANVLPFTATAVPAAQRSRTATTSHVFRHGSGSNGVAAANGKHGHLVHPALPDGLGGEDNGVV